MSDEEPLVEWLPYIGGSLDGTSRPVLTAVRKVAPGKGAERVDGEVYVYEAECNAMVYSPGVTWPVGGVHD